MRLINSKAELLTQGKGLEGMLKHIELCGKVAYKSENNITENSASKFVERIKINNHGAVLEHGTVYLTIPVGTPTNDPQYIWKMDIVRFFQDNKYSVVNSEQVNKPVKVMVMGHGMTAQASATFYYITTNYRVIFEHQNTDVIRSIGIGKTKKESLEESIKEWLTEPTDKHEKRITFRFICSRSISHELVRHRVFSFTQESQRYCNYSHDKFDNQITYIIPTRLSIKPQIVDENNIRRYKEQGEDVYEFITALKASEDYYFSLLDERFGWTPEEARHVLPNATKTEICMTGFEKDWNTLFDIRRKESTGRVHPDMKDLMNKTYLILCL